MKSRKKSEAFNEAVVGLFMIVVILLLAYFTIVISGVEVFGGKDKVAMRIVFDEVGGLKDHDNVMYRGTKVGKVERVEVTPSNLVVVAMVDRGVVIRESNHITVCNLSMLGGNYLLLEEGEGAVTKLDATLYRGDKPTDWMRDVSEVAANFKKLTEMSELRSIVTNINAVSIKADHFMAKATSAAEKADAIAARSQEVVDRVARGESTLGKLLSSDSSMYDEFKVTLTEAKTALGDLKAIAAKLNRDETIENFHAGVKAFRTAAESLDVKNAVAKAETLMGNLNDIALKLKSGEGTLGKLALDSQLYDELNGLIKDCRQVLDNYRDTTPIATFSSLATGAL